MTPLFKKLNLKDEPEIVVLNAPDSFEQELEPLSAIQVSRSLETIEAVHFALAFVITQNDLDTAATQLIEKAEGDIKFWFAYPKKSSKKYTCEFDRDNGWGVLGEAGFEPVRIVAIDKDWSALRFRRVEHIKTLTRNSNMAISKAGKKRTSG